MVFTLNTHQLKVSCSLKVTTIKPGTMTGQVVTSSSSESWTVAWLHFLQRGQKRCHLRSWRPFPHCAATSDPFLTVIQPWYNVLTR